ncbi:hypothetical protein JW868_00825 [Candidatus Woesearchaeota archaeon]|nr:hypothetical protein [Candidatus Woesearchaeota archaeon]
MNSLLKKASSMLEKARRPLFFFDGDPDGTTSFVMLYKKYGHEGKGHIVKNTPRVEADHLKHVKEFGPDLIVILDKPLVEDEFLEGVKGIKVLWVDHHPVQDSRHTLYINPRLFDPDDNRPTAYWAYLLANDHNMLWLAMTGITGDWHYIPELADEFRKKFPKLLPKKIRKQPDALYGSGIGLLARMLSFTLKGSGKDAMTSVKILTRIEDPYEVLEQTTPQGRFLSKKFEKINKVYEDHLKQIKVTRNPIIFYKYEDNKMPITRDLCNELVYKHPKKVVFIARVTTTGVQGSISSTKIVLPPIVERLVAKYPEATGGGHDLAVGVHTREIDFSSFLKEFEREIKKELKKK